MVLLDKLWDDVFAGPQPDHGLGNLRNKLTTKPLNLKDGVEGEGSSSKLQRTLSMPADAPATPMTPTTPSPRSARKDDVWRSVFNPGSNSANRSLGGDLFDKHQPNSPTVYDCSSSIESYLIKAWIV